MIDEYSIMDNPEFSDFFNPTRKKMIAHKALANYFSYGARKTGLEDLKLKDLFAEFYDRYHAAVLFEKYDDVKPAITEITNRVLKKLKTPGVETEFYFGENEIMSAGVKRLDLGEIDENVSVDVNINMLEHVTPFAILHECKHLTQRYAFHNIMRGNKADNNEAICGVVGYSNLLSNYSYLKYELSLDELDANVYAFKTIKNLRGTGQFDQVDKSEIDYMFFLAYAQVYQTLKDFEFSDGKMSDNIQKEIITSYNKVVEDLHKNEMFSQQQLQAIDNLDINAFIKSANKQLFEVSNEFLMMTLEYQDKYNVKLIKDNQIDHQNYNLNMATIYQSIRNSDNKLEEDETL